MKAGVTGECQIRRRGLSPHYWKDAGDSQGLLTADGWLRTGDLATRNRLGLIRLVGRMKDVIKSGGYSVYVRELEEALLAHPAVARAAAFGLPHKDKGEIPVAAVELMQGSQVSADELLDLCRLNLAPYKAPRRIWILEAGGLPLNHTGKVLRRELRERVCGEDGLKSGAPIRRVVFRSIGSVQSLHASGVGARTGLVVSHPFRRERGMDGARSFFGRETLWSCGQLISITSVAAAAASSAWSMSFCATA